jgi:hypothetical protein
LKRRIAPNIVKLPSLLRQQKRQTHYSKSKSFSNAL